MADFSPQPFGPRKFKKADAPDGLTVAFTPNPDILRTLSEGRKPGQKVLGFAAETAADMQALLPLAHTKLQGKKADVLAANRVNATDSGFGAVTNSMRSTKQKLKECLVSPQWREHLDEIAQGGLENIGPLFSFLLLGPQTMHRAAVALGQVTARLMQEQPESAKNIVRRLMPRAKPSQCGNRNVATPGCCLSLAVLLAFLRAWA